MENLPRIQANARAVADENTHESFLIVATHSNYESDFTSWT